MSYPILGQPCTKSYSWFILSSQLTGKPIVLFAKSGNLTRGIKDIDTILACQRLYFSEGNRKTQKIASMPDKNK